MKTRFCSVRLLLASAALGVFAAFAHAGTSSPTGERLTSPTQFQQLKTGEKIVYVCNECKASSEVAIESPAHAMNLCKEHATVTCPACKMKAKVVTKGQRNDPPTRSEVVYTNAAGDECAFYVKKV